MFYSKNGRLLGELVDVDLLVVRVKEVFRLLAALSRGIAELILVERSDFGIKERVFCSGSARKTTENHPVIRAVA